MKRESPVVIYVEGAAKGELANEARRGFSKLLQRCLKNKKTPKVIPCRSRTEALASFRGAKSKGEECLLLLDSEEVAAPGNPWDHPRMLKECPRPHTYVPADLHFMACVVETWLAACPDELERFYGQGFKREKLPTTTDLETAAKVDVYAALDSATKETKTKGVYGKGEHSFKLLAEIDPATVRARCKHWAPRLCEELTKRCA